MFRLDLQRDVLVDDLGHQVAQRLELINVTGIHEYAVCQCAGLIAAGLMRLIEQRAHLRVAAQQFFVEVGGQRFSPAFQQGYGRFDDGTIRSIQHDGLLGLLKRLPRRYQEACQLLILFKS